MSRHRDYDFLCLGTLLGNAATADAKLHASCGNDGLAARPLQQYSVLHIMVPTMIALKILPIK